MKGRCVVCTVLKKWAIGFFKAAGISLCTTLGVVIVIWFSDTFLWSPSAIFEIIMGGFVTLLFIAMVVGIYENIKDDIKKAKEDCVES